jgi:hypothetical protein
VVENLPGKDKALSSNSSTTNQKKQKKKEKNSGRREALWEVSWAILVIPCTLNSDFKYLLAKVNLITLRLSTHASCFLFLLLAKVVLLLTVHGRTSKPSRSRC